MVRLNGRENEFSSKSMKEAIYAGMGLYGLWFVPFVVDAFFLSNIYVYKEYRDYIGHKNMAIVIILIYVICIELLFFRNDRWFSHVAQCQSDTTSVRRLRVAFVGGVVLIMFVVSVVHFLINL